MTPLVTSHEDALRIYRAGYAAGNAAAYQWPRHESPADARLRALDEAQKRGERDYAIERANQGLVTYHRHQQYLMEEAS